MGCSQLPYISSSILPYVRTCCHILSYFDICCHIFAIVAIVNGSWANMSELPGICRRWNRNPRPQPQTLSKLMFLIWFGQSYICLNWLSGAQVGVRGSDFIGSMGRERKVGAAEHPDLAANLRTKILDFRRFWLKQNLDSKGWNSHVHREVPGKFEPTNRSRDNLSREIGRTAVFCMRCVTCQVWPWSCRSLAQWRWTSLVDIYIYVYIYIYIYMYTYVYMHVLVSNIKPCTSQYHDVLWHDMCWHGMAWYGMLLHYITLHYITFYYITSHYITLHAMICYDMS